MDPTRNPIFVVGTGRSGTTLLRFMLSAHPRIYITHEASFYVYEALVGRRGTRRDFLDYYVQTQNFRWLNVDPEVVVGAAPDGGAPFTALMRAKAESYGRVRWGDKTPSHAACLTRIFRDVPEARVIHIVRDPRGVALSLSRMPWAPGSLYANAAFVERERRQVEPFKDRVLQVRLEDLLGDARTTMGRILEYVGEPWDDAVLDHPRNIPDKHDMPPYPWLEGAARERAPQGVPWASLSPVEVRMIEGLARRSMAEHGYEPAPLDQEPSRLRVWWEGVRQLPLRLHALGCYLRLARLSFDPRNFDSGKMLAVWHRLNPPAWSRYPGFEIPNPPPHKLLPEKIAA